MISGVFEYSQRCYPKTAFNVSDTTIKMLKMQRGKGSGVF